MSLHLSPQALGLLTHALLLGKVWEEHSALGVSLSHDLKDRCPLFIGFLDPGVQLQPHQLPHTGLEAFPIQPGAGRVALVLVREGEEAAAEGQG